MMRYGVEALDQIALNDPCGTCAVGLGHMVQRLDRVTVGPKAIGAGAKDRLVNRRQNLRHYRLDYPVADGRNSQPPPSRRPFRDVDAAHGLGDITVVLKL